MIADSSTRVPWTRLAIVGGILALTLVSYWPALSAGFIWDDDDYVTENPLLRDADGLRRIWTTTETPQYYPLVFTTFWLEYHLWGLSPLGYHLVNVALHAINAFLIGLVLRGLGVRGAWWVALLFAVHPVHVESVAWVTERKNVLSALFYLVAFLSYLDFERRGKKISYALALLSFVCAMLAKTVTASLPVALVLALLWRNGRIGARDLRRLAPFFAIAVGLALITVQLEEGMVGAVSADFVFSWWQRVVIACRALLFYPLKILFPYPLIFNYPRWDLDAGGLSLIWPVVAVLIVGAMLFALWRKGNRGTVLPALYYAATIFPALGFLNVYPFRYSFVADHFQYLASIGVLILLVQAVIVLDRQIVSRLPLPAGRPASAIGAAGLLVLALLTWSQSLAYRDLPTLWRDTIAKNPGSWLAHNNLGLIYLENDRYEQALEHLDRAVASKPGSAESYTARGLARAGLGLRDEALEDLDRAIELDPSYPQARLNRGNLRLDTGRFDGAVEDLTRFMENNPDYLPARRSLARARLLAGHHDQAIADFTEFIDSSPDYAAYLNRGVAYVNVGDFKSAVEDFTRALQLEPGSVEAYSNRGFALVRSARVRLALADFDRAIAIDPGQAKLFAMRGGAWVTLGDLPRACQDWQRACALGDCRHFEQNCRLRGR